jgi:hypothetical protein
MARQNTRNAAVGKTKNAEKDEATQETHDVAGPGLVFKESQANGLVWSGRGDIEMIRPLRGRP